jgi:hypothetical protein
MGGGKMTDEQINIAIAESLGWHSKSGANGGVKWVDKDGIGRNGGGLYGYGYNDELLSHLPDYTSDLNACHAAVLNHPRKELLRRFLYLEVLEDPTNTTNEPAWANAKQFSTAYVKSIGKWIE